MGRVLRADARAVIVARSIAGACVSAHAVLYGRDRAHLEVEPDARVGLEPELARDDAHAQQLAPRPQDAVDLRHCTPPP